MNILATLFIILGFAVILILMYYLEDLYVRMHTQIANAVGAPVTFHIDYRLISQYAPVIFSIGVIFTIFMWLSYRDR